jgi:hypothetical protein
VAAERAQAVRSHSAAIQAAVQAARDASASAAERVARSKVDAIAFQADRQAASVGGQSFLLERYLHALTQGLRQAQPIIIDHRIPASALPTIDLRPAANNPGLPAIDLHGAPIATEPPPPSRERIPEEPDLALFHHHPPRATARAAAGDTGKPPPRSAYCCWPACPPACCKCIRAKPW